jgi:phosphodiesterase/alkaline phosphatase D-like protein
MRLFHPALVAVLTAAALSPFGLPSSQAAELPSRVAAGDVTQDSAVLWARSESAGGVRFELFADPGLTTPAGAPVDVAVGDPLVPAKTAVTGLQSGTMYYYRATDALGSTSTGQFRTAAAPGDRTGLRFGVSGDWRGELAPYPAVANAPSRGLDFFVALGDTIYADYPSPAVPAPQATSLAEYRGKNAEVYSGRFGVNSLGELRASTALFATVDDHEVTNDFAGGAAIATDPRFSAVFPGDNPADRINDSTLYENGLRAFQEFNPISEEFYADTGVDPRFDGERKLYRERRFGDDAALFLLDARSFRDREVNLANPSEIPALFDPSRTMLGKPQLDDLKGGLLDAQVQGVTWKFVLVPEPIQQLGSVGAQDRFEGYFAERNDLLRFIDNNGVKNVVFVAADVHGTVVNDLSYYDNGLPSGSVVPTGALEITTGSVAFDAPFGQTVEAIAAGPGFQVYGDQVVQNAGFAYGVIDAATLAAIQALNDPLAENAAYFAALQNAPLRNRNAFQQALLNQLFAADPIYGALDPVGLEPGEGIEFTVLAGDNPLTPGDEAFFQTFFFTWTELSVDGLTQELLVTTYGIDPYSEAGLLSDPESVVGRVPEVLSQFRIEPQAPGLPLPGTLGLIVLGLGGLASLRLARRPDTHGG